MAYAPQQLGRRPSLAQPFEAVAMVAILTRPTAEVRLSFFVFLNQIVTILK